jgi:twitching motility protein PilT
MQTFDQSLMSLLKAQVITYEESLRQATNPDDFALRVSGISGTSDSKWDSFEKAEPSAPPAARPPLPVAGAPRAAPAGGPGTPLGRVGPPRAPKAPGGGEPGAGGDDDFQIERF